MLNTLQIMGRLTADPELKTTPNGVSACTVSLAVERNYAKNNQREVDFIPVVMWRKTAEFAAKHFQKGQLVCVTGSLQSRSYKAKDGTNRHIIEVVADQLYFTGDKPQQAAPAQQTQQYPQQAAPAQQTQQYPQQAAPVQQTQQYPQQAVPVQQTQQYPQQTAPVQQTQQYPQQAVPVQQTQQYPQQAAPVQQYQQFAQQATQYQSPQQFGVDEINLSDDDLPF